MVPADRPIALMARGLTKEFKGFFAVKDLDISVREGSVHALIGPNGAGKTTVFNLLTKFLMPTRGSISFFGTDITGLPAADVALRGLVRSFQISAIFPNFTVLENVRVALQRNHGLGTQFWRPQKVLRALDEEACELIGSVGMLAMRDVLAGELPYGRKRALELATTLALKPKVLLLDEPMAGIAHEDIGPIAEVIRRASRGRTVVMVEHNLSVVQDLCDFVTVLERGRTLAEGTYAEVSADPRVLEAYIGAEDD
ncbi:MAG: ABC transporter ATP-binding protein [Rhizobiaceae bacterium]|nr:ABC transporter ATP-binding protein [Rhizobiaceae bacterium]